MIQPELLQDITLAGSPAPVEARLAYLEAVSSLGIESFDLGPSGTSELARPLRARFHLAVTLPVLGNSVMGSPTAGLNEARLVVGTCDPEEIIRALRARGLELTFVIQDAPSTGRFNLCRQLRKAKELGVDRISLEETRDYTSLESVKEMLMFVRDYFRRSTKPAPRIEFAPSQRHPQVMEKLRISVSMGAARIRCDSRLLGALYGDPYRLALRTLRNSELLAV